MGGSRVRRVAVVGAGMVGLSVAWFLQEHDVEVVVYDRETVAVGASWGNAGWLAPTLATPLPEPAVLRYGLRALARPAAPLYVPPSLDPRLLVFLLRFARNSTTHRWQRAMSALAPINRAALAAFDALTNGGVQGATHQSTSFLAAFTTPVGDTDLFAELAQIASAGQPVDFATLTGTQAREICPALSEQVCSAIQLHGQRFIDPGRFVHSLADSVRARGGQILDRATVTDVRATHGETVGGLRVVTAEHVPDSFHSVVLATGAWLGDLARAAGVRTVVAAGRGYSFSVPADPMPTGPVYFPDARVACTPLDDGLLRVAGMMEFRSPAAPLDPRRVDAIVAATSPLLTGADFDTRTHQWVGARPCTPDGLPLIGRTRTPNVYVAGGHGMWGITLGPVTGQLLARAITTDTVPAELADFNPLR